jgi:hypothetical protein
MNPRFCWSYREDLVLRLILVILLPVKASPRSQLLIRDAASPVCTASERARSRKFNAQDSGLTFFSAEGYSCREGALPLASSAQNSERSTQMRMLMQIAISKDS